MDTDALVSELRDVFRVEPGETLHAKHPKYLGNRAADAIERLTRERDEATDFISRRGYRRCDIAACNCGSWHGGNAEDRLSEIREAMLEHGFDLNGKTFVQAIEETGTALSAARAERDTQINERVSERLAQKEQEILAIRQAHEQRLGELESEIAEQKASFDLRWKADMRAIKRWQEATGQTLTWPDHADLCVWLLGERDGILSERNNLMASLAYTEAELKTARAELAKRLPFNLGDPVTLRPGYKYGEWVGTDQWFAGIVANSDGSESVWLVDQWPPRDTGMTDGFRLDDIDHRALKEAPHE